jgi:predicted transcriptional regulator
MAYIFSALALLLSIVSFFAIFFYVKKRTAVDRIPAETREAVSLIINEIERITDRDSELIEERIKKLKSLIEDIDRRIAAYERQAASYQTAEETKKKLNEKKDAAAVETYRMLGKTYTARETSPLVISVTENSAAHSVAAAPDEEERPHRAREAAHLSAAGMPNNEIAKRLHITVNEVEMALFLRRHGGAGV